MSNEIFEISKLSELNVRIKEIDKEVEEWKIVQQNEPSTKDEISSHLVEIQYIRKIMLESETSEMEKKWPTQKKLEVQNRRIKIINKEFNELENARVQLEKYRIEQKLRYG